MDPEYCIMSERRSPIRKNPLQFINFNVLFTVHLSINLDNDQLDTHLLYFTIRLL